MGTRSKRQLSRRQKTSWSFETLEPRLVMAVVINEFLAANTAGIQDQDSDRSDWIELKNTDVAPVNVGGWYLTDEAAVPNKWALPSTTIPAGGYLLVWASGKDRAVSGQELHTNFNLDQAGEYLGLVMPDGVTVADAYAPFPAQVNDISYGRGTGGTVTDGLVGDFAQLKVLVPTTNAVDVAGATPWTAVAYNEAASAAGTWTAGQSGVGYDVNNVGSDLTPYVLTSTLAQMNSAARGSAYIRMPFSVGNPADLVSLKLRIRYDDGIAVYLNGHEITAARRNFSTVNPLSFSSVANTTRADASAIAYEDIDLTASKNFLVAGSNVLAIHGLNRVVAQSGGNTAAQNFGDFLIDARLEANRTIPGLIGYMSTPTPNAANQVGTLGVVADTQFSVKRGYFNAPFNVQISTTTPGAVIRYTTNGIPPTETTGTVYNPASPPLVTTTTTIRAAAFKTGWTATNIDTQTYIFANDVVHQTGATVPGGLTNWGGFGPDWSMDTDIVDSPAYSSQITAALTAIPTVSLVAPWASWFGPAGVGIYPTQSELETATSMEYFTPDGSEQFHITGSIEIQGGTSDDRWKTDKLSMRVHFKEPFGPEKLDANPFHNGAIDAGAAQTFNTLYLDAQINYSWPYGGASGSFAGADQRLRAKYIQDQYVSDLQNLAGGAAPHGRFVQVYINGMYWGIYDMHERPDEHFAESYLGGNNDDYDVIKHTATTEVSPDPPSTVAIADYADMLDLVRAADMATNPASYAAVAAKLDIDAFIDYMIINDYVGNDDWAHHNWYATFNRVDPTGRWRFHSWDAEHTLKDVNRNSTTLNNTGAPTEILNKLAAAPEFRLRFADRVQKLFYNGGLLSPTGAAAAYQTRMNEVSLALIAESARWGDSRTNTNDQNGGGPAPGDAYTQADWIATQADLMANYFPQRTGIVANQFFNRGWNVTLAAPTFLKYGGTVMAGYSLTLAKPVGSPAAAKVYYTLDGSDPRDPSVPTTNLRASAIEYTGAPIVINAGKQVNARIFQDLAGTTVDEWSPIIETTFLLETPFPLRITELNYNPQPQAGFPDAQDIEFIELMNTGAQSISLDGVQITEFSSTPYVFPNGITLAAGERIIVPRTPGTFNNAYGAGYNVASTGYYGPAPPGANLSNGGERIVLLGPVGETLQDFTYVDGGPSDGNGKSLEVINPLGDLSSPANWRASFYHGGSPGTEGLAPSVAGDFDGDGDVDGGDFLAWQRGVGTPQLQGTAAKGDADGDRDVDSADLALLRSNFGTVPMLAASFIANNAAAVMADDSPSIIVSSHVAAVLENDEWILTDTQPSTAKLSASRPDRARLFDGAITALHSLHDAGRIWPLAAARSNSHRGAGAGSRHAAADEALSQDADDEMNSGLACDLGGALRVAHRTV
jgi:hypothetical protein